MDRLQAPVISVGNLTVGGTGKTPLVEWICKALAAEGRKVCVLTRGYKRERENERVLVSDGATLQAEVLQAGDEAFLLAQHLLGRAAVVSDSNRLRAGIWAMRELGCDAFVLDDGFQHLQLFRDLNLLVIDSTDPWGSNQLLPYGRLREPVSGLKRADCVVITRVNDPDTVTGLVSEVQNKSSKPVFTTRMVQVGLKTISGERVHQGDLPQPIAAFCGIGNPESFFSQLVQSKLSVSFRKAFPDHHLYSQKDVDALIEAASQKGARALFTTEKDAVKLGRFKFELPCYCQEIAIEIDQESQFMDLLRATLKESRNM
jgi:tetraacyldisaccharide 4'-kinase